MIQVLIIEDEIPAQRVLRDILHEIDFDVEVIGWITSIKAAVEWFESNTHPDIVLLDIHLSDGLSFEIFRQVSINSMIIFTTAYDEYALQAFKVNSIDYLLKPVEKDEMQRAFEKYHLYSKTGVDAALSGIDFTELATVIKSQKHDFRKRFLIQSNDSFFHIPVEQIAFFYSLQGVTFAVTFNKVEYPINYTLESLKEQLHPDQFFKVNRKYIVNMDCIRRVHSFFQGKLKLETHPSHNENIVVGKDKAALFKRWLDR